MRRTILCALILVACSSSSRAPATSAPSNAKPYVEPVVDMACVARARDGQLADGLPTEAGTFRVTATPSAAHLHRDGRALTDAESARLWDVMGEELFTDGGLAGGNSGRSSIYTCDDAPKLACFKLEAWICQVDLATIAQRLERAAEKTGVGDALLSIDVAFVEGHGPACRDGARCVPAQHYSTKGTYDRGKPRHAGRGTGSCENDGDCVGADSNLCMSWWLRGGAETLLYEMRGQPTFCGCVEQRCAWFTQ